MADNIIVHTLEVRGAITVEVRHDLLADKVGIADGIFVEVGLQLQFIFKVGNQ